MVGGIILGGGIVTAAAIGLGAMGYRRLSGVMPFLFANARIQARSHKSVSENQLESLADKKTLNEVIASLKETEYAPALENSATAREVHSALEQSLLGIAAELFSITPKNFQKIIGAYLRFYESKILKAVYKSRFFPQPMPIDKSLVFPVGGITEAKLEKLLETKTIADINTVMASTDYAPVFAKNYESLEDFEVALDNHVFSHFAEVAQKSKIKDKKHILDVLGIKLDIINLLVLVKCIVRGIEKQKRKQLLVQNKTSWLQNRTDALIEAEDFKALVNACNGTPYAKTMEKALDSFGKDSMLFHFETELHRLFSKTLLDRELYHIQGPYPLFSYLLKKEIEVKNLMIISKGIESSFSKEEIRELIV